MKKQVRCKGPRMRIVGEMTVYTAVALQAEILNAIDSRPDTRVIELSEVTEFDTAGLQILLVARRLAATLGRELQVLAPSPAVGEVLELLQLHELAGAPAKADA